MSVTGYITHDGLKPGNSDVLTASQAARPQAVKEKPTR